MFARHIKPALVVALLSGLVLAAGLQRARAQESLTIGGTGSALGAMTQLAEAYMRAHPHVAITVPPSLGSNGGLKALRAGALDISLSTDPLAKEVEAEGLTAVLYAKTLLGFATQLDNPTGEVTAEWVMDVYRGEVTEWPDGGPVRLVLRPAHDSDMKILSAFSEPMKEAMEAALARPGLLIEDSAQSSAETIAKLDGSFGSSTLAQVMSEGLNIKLLGFNGVEPTLSNLASGKYPFVKAFYYVSRPDASAAARDFMRFLESHEAAAILREGGNIAVSRPRSG